MLIFLGSTLENLNDKECNRFLTQIQQALQPGEFFLLGVDLQKPIETIEAAYNDAEGVTAEFGSPPPRVISNAYLNNWSEAEII